MLLLHLQVSVVLLLAIAGFSNMCMGISHASWDKLAQFVYSLTNKPYDYVRLIMSLHSISNNCGAPGNTNLVLF